MFTYECLSLMVRVSNSKTGISLITDCDFFWGARHGRNHMHFAASCPPLSFLVQLLLIVTCYRQNEVSALVYHNYVSGSASFSGEKKKDPTSFGQTFFNNSAPSCLTSLYELFGCCEMNYFLEASHSLWLSEAAPRFLC